MTDKAAGSDAAARSRTMRAVKSGDTAPERAVRRLAHRLGYRYRLHRSDLPGKPDLVFPSRRKVVLVHGCFWHQHTCRRGNRRPATNRTYWDQKLDRNKRRDRRVRSQLRRGGWDVLVVWECQTTPARLLWLKKRLTTFLDS
jgi:DNA mismatch endonuclease (patch repair protein)